MASELLEKPFYWSPISIQLIGIFVSDQQVIVRRHYSQVCRWIYFSGYSLIDGYTLKSLCSEIKNSKWPYPSTGLLGKIKKKKNSLNLNKIFCACYIFQQVTFTFPFLYCKIPRSKYGKYSCSFCHLLLSIFVYLFMVCTFLIWQMLLIWICDNKCLIEPEVIFHSVYSSCQALKLFAKDEVSLHNTRTDCWIIIKGKVMATLISFSVCQ